MPPEAVLHDPAREIADRVAMPGTPFVYASTPEAGFAQSTE